MIVYLDVILIYTNKANHVNAIWYIFNQLTKYFLYANVKNYHFYRNEVQLLGYVVYLQDLYMEHKEIKTVHDCFEPQSVQDIQTFLWFANFY